MSAGDRFRTWLDVTASGWANRLAAWMGGWVSGGIIRLIEAIEPEGIDFIDETLAQIAGTPQVPQNIRNLIGKIRGGGKPIPLLLAIPIAVLLFLPVVQSLFAPAGRILTYLAERPIHSGRLDPSTAVRANWRELMEEEWLVDTLRDLGYAEKDITTIREVLKFYPGPQDLITFQAHEVFEPDMRNKYGLDDEFEKIDLEPFRKAGMTDEIVKWYWRSHWEHASWNQVVEMLHRGQLEEDDVREWFRLVEIPPYWRDKLIATSWNVPTRVDVRRFWDMRTISPERLEEIYKAQGYHGDDLKDYVLWTKVYVDFPTLMARWKNGWIQLQDVRDRLVELGMPADRAEELIQEKVQAEGFERTKPDRELTLTDIYKGVKQERISRRDAVELIMDLGYDESEATFKLDVNVPEDDTATNKKIREITKGDIAAAVKESIISPTDAIVKLTALRYSIEDATFLAAIYAAQIPIEKIEGQRELAKGDITKALKNGYLSPGEAKTMLIGLRYSDENAQFLVDTNMPSEADLDAEVERQVSKSDIRASLKAGVLTDEEAIRRLVAIGYNIADAEFLVNLYSRLLALSQITRPKEASKTDIILAVKKGLITPEEGYLLLQSIGFSSDASTFILAVHAEESPFSPIDINEFKDLTNQWRRSAGMITLPVPDDVRQAAQELVRVSREVATLELAVASERRQLTDPETAPESAKKKLNEFQVALNRARAEKERLQLKYDSLVAAWKRGQEGK